MRVETHLLLPLDRCKRDGVDELVECVAKSGKRGEESHTLGADAERQDLHCMCDGQRGEGDVIEAEVTKILVRSESQGHAKLT